MSDFLGNVALRLTLLNVAGEYRLAKIGLKGQSKASNRNIEDAACK